MAAADHAGATLQVSRTFSTAAATASRAAAAFRVAAGRSSAAWPSLVVFWLFNSIYTIDPQEVGVELQFGKPKPELSQPGLHFHWWPIEDVERVIDRAENQTSIGSSASGRNGANEGLMLSGDQNIVDVRFSVLWAVSQPGRVPVQRARSGRHGAQRRRKRDARSRRPPSGAGHLPRRPGRHSPRGAADHPGHSRQLCTGRHASTTMNHRTARRRRPKWPTRSTKCSVPSRTRRASRKKRVSTPIRCSATARGQAAQIREDAAAYKNRVVQEAEGEAARFVSIYNEYATRARSDAQAAVPRNDGTGAGRIGEGDRRAGRPGRASCPTCRCRRCSRAVRHQLRRREGTEP